MTQVAVSSDGWERARQGARAVRYALAPLGASGDDRPAPVLLAAALDRAALSRDALAPGDPLLFGARAVLDVEMGAVWVRADAPARQQSVLVAHELGHLHLHYKRSEPQDDALALSGYYCYESDLDESAGGTAGQAANEAVGYGPRARRETEANVFAREFLLPCNLARRLFAEDGLTASAIADRLDVPLSLVYSQLTEALTRRTESATDDVATFDTADAVALVSPVPPDESQRRAAEASAGPLLVGAGPGTGKTRTLVARVLYLTDTLGVRPENLLLLTFSRKAAREMRERIAAQSPDAARRATIGTFHAYGLDLLRRYWKEAGLPPSPVLLNRAEAFGLLEQRIADLPLTVLAYLHDPTFPFPDILGAIGRYKEKLVSPDALRALANAQTDDDQAAKWREVADVYAIYEELLRDRGALDYSDLIARALLLLENNAHVLQAERARWRHVLVDEYQDINRAGARLVRQLTGSGDEQAGDNGAGLWAVGDLRQAIYAFRGASPANVSRWERDFPGGARAELAVNYRSQPTLVEAFGTASGEGAAMWRAFRTGAGSVTLAVADDDAAQADNIAEKMRRFVADGYGWGDMVALCRTHGQARALRAALTLRQIPVADATGAGAGGAALLGSSDARDLVALLSLACEPNSPARHLYPNGAPPGLPHYTGDAYHFFAQVLWGDMGRARTLDADSAASIADLLALARAFRDRASVLIAPGMNPLQAFLSHVRRLLRLDGALPQTARSASRDDDPENEISQVRVLTVHAAKGLEFPVVFVPNLSAGKFPSQAPPSLLPALAASGTDTDDDADEVENVPSPAAVSEEEARLFFVALTRARDYLVVSRAEKYNNRSAKPSPLLACLDNAPAVLRETWQAAEEEKDKGERIKDKNREEGEPDAEGLEVLSFVSHPSSFPVAAVGDYLVCPRRYYYAHEANAPTGTQGVYGAFSSAVRVALDADSPADALPDAWDQHGPHADHPHAALYRRRAEDFVRNAPPTPPRPATGDAPQPEATPLSLQLPHGTLDLRVDSPLATSDGAASIEQRSFRKPPKPDATEAHSDDVRLHLLREAVGPDTPIAVRYLQNNAVLPAPDKPKIRAKHVAAYDDALRGIGLKVFPPAPADGAADCAACAFLFVCPSE